MALSLFRSSPSTLPVGLEGITPDRIRERTLAEIERIETFHGNRRVPLAELFRVSGNPSDGRIEFGGELGAVDHIGAGMDGGEIVVHGDAGRHVGAGMTGGTIRVMGSAGDWVGAEMKGGVIYISGSAEDHAGAAYAGSRRGMTEGAILIDGSAGDGVGRSLRRGLVAIGGSCGSQAGFGMIAGTILVFGACGPYLGAEMRRGTIGLFGPEPPRLLPTFRWTGKFRPLFLRLIERELQRLGFPMARALPGGELTLYHGDLLSLGKGEVWIREGGAAR
jgi:formylmethanofuran dehydrogenase subunit C